MSVGDSAKIGVRSYTAFAKESTFGTYATATTAIEALSVGFKVEKESIKLETLNRKRSFSKRVQTIQNVAGAVESYLHPQESVLLVATAMGGGIGTASISAATFTHSITAGNFDTSPASLSFNVRKGDTHTWEYVGGRPNVCTIAAEIGSPVTLSLEMVFKDATQLANDISAALSVSSVIPYIYHQGSYIYAATEGALTTTAAEPIQSFELVINNNIVSDAPARKLGTQIPDVLPPTTRNIELTVTQRFDTTTNYQRFIQATQGAVRLEFVGASITAATNYKWQIDLPKVFMNTPDPEIGGPGEVIQSEFTFDVIDSDINTTTGKDIGMTVINDVSAY